MEVRIKSQHMTRETREYLDGRLAALEKLMGKDAAKARCEVEISRAAGRKKTSDHMWLAEIHVVAPGAEPLYAKNHAQTVNAAIDDVKEEIERQIRSARKAVRRDIKKKGSELKRLAREV